MFDTNPSCVKQPTRFGLSCLGGEDEPVAGEVPPVTDDHHVAELALHPAIQQAIREIYRSHGEMEDGL